MYVMSQFCCRSTDHFKRYGQWAVISGSTDGIGKAMAMELARRGLSIVVIGRNEEKLANTKSALQAEPNVGEVMTVKIDLSDASPQNYERVRLELDPDNRDIGILINNAGFASPKLDRYAGFDMDEIRNTVNVNILATLYFTRMILPGMLKRRRGLILNVSSALGSVPMPYSQVYPATKAFIDSFTQSLQIEYSSYPVDIIHLSPGTVQTKLAAGPLVNEPNPNLFWPLPIISPDYYAKTALNAVTTKIKSISGTIIHGLSLIGLNLVNNLGMLHMIPKSICYTHGITIPPVDQGSRDMAEKGAKQPA